MAKKHARGRQTVREWMKEYPGKALSEHCVTTKETDHIALMTDGRLLRRRVVWFAPGPFDNGKPVRHDYGWKLWKKLRQGVEIATYRPECFTTSGYTEV